MITDALTLLNNIHFNLQRVKKRIINFLPKNHKLSSILFCLIKLCEDSCFAVSTKSLCLYRCGSRCEQNEAKYLRHLKSMLKYLLRLEGSFEKGKT